MTEEPKKLYYKKAPIKDADGNAIKYTHKTCSKCKLDKPFDSYSTLGVNHATQRQYYQAYCKQCAANSRRTGSMWRKKLDQNPAERDFLIKFFRTTNSAYKFRNATIALQQAFDNDFAKKMDGKLMRRLFIKGYFTG